MQSKTALSAVHCHVLVVFAEEVVVEVGIHGVGAGSGTREKW